MYRRFCLEDKLELQREPYYRLPSNKELEKFTNDTKSLHLSSDESEKSSRCSFSALPDEVIVKILELIDWRSLCRVSRVNKRLNRIAQDPHFYTYLDIDLESIRTSPENERSLFDYFTPRCERLQLLNLNAFSIDFSDLIVFLDICGGHLTHLRLEACQCMSNFTLLQIVDACQNLKELNLDCVEITDEGFFCLETLQFLECLNLHGINGIHMKSKTLRNILQRNPRIRHLHLYINPEYMTADDVAVEVRNACRDLENIALLDTWTLTSRGLNALADCKNLRKVDFGGCGSIWTTIMKTFHHSDYGESFHKFFSSCQRLEEIDLGWFDRLTDYNLEALALCKNLKCLTLTGIQLTNTICLKILRNCPKLENFYISCDDDLKDRIRKLFNQWIEEYGLHGVRVHFCDE